MHILRPIVSRYRSLLARGTFGNNVLVMFIGTALGQFGAVLLSPFLTRIYSPEMFGVLGLFTASTSILSVIAALRYEMALPLAQSQEDAANLLAVSIFALFATTFIACSVILVLSAGNAGDAPLGMLTPYRWLLPVGFFCIGAYQMMIYYATREGAFGIIARTKIYQGALGPLSQIGLGIAGAGTWGLIIGFIIGQSTGVSQLFARLVVASRQWKYVTLAGMKAMAVRFRRFPLLSSWSGLLEAAGSTYLLLVSVPILYSNAIGGFVFLTDRVIGRPLLLISTSVLQVYVGDMSKLLSADPAAMRKRFLQLAGQQLVIVAVWLALVNLAAPTLFPIVFGQEWQAAVPYLQVLSIAYLPMMVMHALVHTLQIMERQGLSAAWETGRLVAVIGALVISRAMGLDALHALLAYSVVQALAQMILFLLMYRSIQSLLEVKQDAKA